MLHGSAHGIGGKACAQALAEPGDSTAVFAGRMAQLFNRGAGADPAHGAFADRGMLPTRAIRMILALLCGALTEGGKKCNRQRKCHRDSHTVTGAITLP